MCSKPYKILQKQSHTVDLEQHFGGCANISAQIDAPNDLASSRKTESTISQSLVSAPGLLRRRYDCIRGRYATLRSAPEPRIWEMLRSTPALRASVPLRIPRSGAPPTQLRSHIVPGSSISFPDQPFASPNDWDLSRLQTRPLCQ